jgi:hypothetical protein
MFNLLDTDHNGLLGLAEFCSGLEKFFENESCEYLQEKRIWGVISKSSWIPQSIFIQKLSEACGVDQD